METPDDVAFETVFVDRRPPVAAVAGDLIALCRVFSDLGFASMGGQATGNLSSRLDQGFLITPAGVPFPQVEAEDLVHVLEVRSESGVVLAQGVREPSSETRLHAAIYERRREILAVFHGHSDELVARGASLGLVSTEEELPQGSQELAEAAAEAAARSEFFILRNHGFVAIGQTTAEAAGHALDAIKKVRGTRLP